MGVLAPSAYSSQMITFGATRVSVFLTASRCTRSYEVTSIFARSTAVVAAMRSDVMTSMPSRGK